MFTKFLHVKKEFFWVFACIGVVVFVVFGQSVQFDFVSWDDPIHITGNELVYDFSHVDFFNNLTNYYGHTWLTHYYWGVVYTISDGNPMYFHLLNVIFHTINSLLVYVLAKKLFNEKLIPIFVAILFAVHPLHVEPVVWASAFKDLFFSFFYLLSILVYIDYLDKNKVWKLGIICILFFLSSSSKIQALHLPLVLLFIELYRTSKLSLKSILFFILLSLLGIKQYSIFIWFSGLFIIVDYMDLSVSKIKEISQNFKDYLKSKKLKIRIIVSLLSGSFLLAVILFFISKLSGINISNYWDFEQNIFYFSISERILMSAYALTYYIKMYFAPITLIAVHPYPNFDLSGTAESFIPYLLVYPLIITVSYIIFRNKRISNADKKLFFFGLLFFLINISFVLHIIPIHGRLIVADRYAYLSIFGLLIIVFILLEKLLRINRVYIIVFSSIFFFFYVYQSKSYSKVWSDSFSLYDDVISKKPEIAFPYNNKGLLYFQERNYNLAIENFELALSADSTYYNAYYNKALLFLEIGDYNEAISDFNFAIKHTPFDDSEILTSRGWTYYLLQNYEYAINDYNTAIEIDSTYDLAYNNRALLKFDIGDFQGAFIDVNKAIDCNPNMYEAYNNRGWFKLESNDIHGALHDFEQAYKLNPEYSNSLMNLAWTHFLDYNYHAAAKYYKEAFDRNNNNIKALYYLGLSELNRNNLDDACYYLSMAKERGYVEAIEAVKEWCVDF
jgi:protein O-mannosyl-transferase